MKGEFSFGHKVRHRGNAGKGEAVARAFDPVPVLRIYDLAGGEGVLSESTGGDSD